MTIIHILRNSHFPKNISLKFNALEKKHFGKKMYLKCTLVPNYGYSCTVDQLFSDTLLSKVSIL